MFLLIEITFLLAASDEFAFKETVLFLIKKIKQSCLFFQRKNTPTATINCGPIKEKPFKEKNLTKLQLYTEPNMGVDHQTKLDCKRSCFGLLPRFTI